MTRGIASVIGARRESRWLGREARGVFAKPKFRGFTLIELRVEIAIIPILAALLLPAAVAQVGVGPKMKDTLVLVATINRTLRIL